MGVNTETRVIRSGDYVPTIARTGDEGDNLIWRKRNLITRYGGTGNPYEEVLRGPLQLNQSAPLVALTGTLAFTANQDTVTGTGTLFLTECHLGQRIIVIDPVAGKSVLLIPKRIISNTSMIIWQDTRKSNPYVSMTGVTGYRMYRCFAINDQLGMLLWGNALRLDRGSILSVGNGVFYLDGVVLPGSSLTATRAPQISIQNAGTGNFLNYTLGMTQPTGITAAAVAGGTKGMRAGNYSLVVSRARWETDGFNNPSLRIDVTLAANDKVRVTFPAMETARGQSAWKVYVTPYSASLPTTLPYLEGPWFFLDQVDNVQVNPAGGTFDFEWYDAELLGAETASFDNDPPPDGEFYELLNFNPILASCQGPRSTAPGPFIFPSKPSNIEAAPPNIAFSSSPPETILGVVPGPGRVYALTTNHLQIIQATPSDVVPMLMRPFWKDGFATPEGGVFHNGNFYGWTTGGPSKSRGDGDEQDAEKGWAGKVWEIMRNWNSGQVLTAYNPTYDTIDFYHIADRLNEWGFWTTRFFMWGVPQERWVGDGEFSQPDRDSIVSGVATVGEQMRFLMGGRRIS